MEPLKRVMHSVETYPLYCAKVILIITGLFVTANNFFDCVMDADIFINFILYSGIPFAACIVLATTKSKYPLICILVIFGSLMVLDSKEPNTMTAGALFFVAAKRVADNIYFSLLVYFVTALSIAGASLYYVADSKDALNVLSAYFVVYLLDHLTYKYKENMSKEVV